MPFFQGEGEHKEISAITGTGEENPCQSDGQDEQIDQKQVGREQPHGLPDMLLVGIFDHHDMELAGEKHDRPHGDCQHGKDGGVGDLAGTAERGQMIQKFRLGSGYPAEDVVKTIEEKEGDKNSDHHEGAEFDD